MAQDIPENVTQMAVSLGRWMEMNDCKQVAGLTNAAPALRDEFAKAAMPVILERWGSHQQVGHPSIAQLAYEMADAMLAARLK